MKACQALYQTTLSLSDKLMRRRVNKINELRVQLVCELTPTTVHHHHIPLTEKSSIIWPHLSNDGCGDPGLGVHLGDGRRLRRLDLHHQAELFGKECGERAVRVFLGRGEVSGEAAVA